ncbi:phage antirepressor KilAC domain-containing protein, partial [[Eubacterium] hominis]|uniref:phage antirepressor KilAC domain-containing protein n=1 Tax=[Eubacterium] hominis TaxID=2764325 RepID=UPI003A521F59
LDKRGQKKKGENMNELQIIEYSNQRVLTTQQLAEVYETSETNIKTNFNRNKERFVAGKHYYVLKGDDLKEFKRMVTNSNDPSIKFASILYLWTEKGADRHCKILDTDKAWEQFDNLEDTYFKVKEMFDIPKSLPEALRKLADEVELTAKLQLENKIKDQQIGELQPKADYCDLILKSKSLCTINAIAKDYGMSAVTMNKKLHELGVQYKQGGIWLLYHKYQSKGYTQSETIEFNHTDGRPDTRMHTKWTQKGRLFLYELLKAHDILPMIERDENG